MNKDQIISELFFSFRCAKRLLEIDHPTCGCGKTSVGCHIVQVSLHKRVVEGLCQDHWEHFNKLDYGHWRVKWDYLEDAKEVTLEEKEQHPMDKAFSALNDIVNGIKDE